MQNKSAESETNPAIEDEKFGRFDIHLELLNQKDHPRIMNLEKKIPLDYPWETFLKKHFSHPPFELKREDYEKIIVGKNKILKIIDSRKPTTFHSLFRFLEFFRTSLVMLENNLNRIEDQHAKLKKTANEHIGIKNLLKNYEWNYSNIENKHSIMKGALEQKMQLDGFVSKLETILSQNLNITSRWQYIIEPFYNVVIRYANNNFSDGCFNLRTFFPIKTMAEKLKPHYTQAMNLVIELNEAVLQTSEFIKRKNY